MILIISHEGDPHAMRVLGHLQAMRRDVALFDLAEFPDHGALSIDYGGETPSITWRRDDGPAIALDEAEAVWWRRPQAPDLSGVGDADTHLFTANEWNEALNGAWQLMLGARWMNNPDFDDAASRKARQLRVAREAGLRIPRTLITSDPARAREFIAALAPARVAYKTFSCTHAVWRETRLLQESDHALLDAVSVAPVIFQEYIPADADLRVTMVGDRCFPASIRWRQEGDSIDFRRNVGAAAMEATTLPDETLASLKRLMASLNLVYGAIDLRLTPAGEMVFFEVNTAGEFLFVEDRTGQPIARAIAGWLAGEANVSRPVVPVPSFRQRRDAGERIPS